MNKSDFLLAKEFIYSDIQREINLALASQNCIGNFFLRRLINNSGGGNFIAALGLLSYTEFAGRLKFNKLKKNGDSVASENFNCFFDLLGDDYKTFRKNHNVYDIFRCGLSHEYFIKKNFIIYMLGARNPCGIGCDKDGKYFFVVEKYLIDFKIAFDALEGELSFDV